MIYRKSLETAINVGADYDEADIKKVSFSCHQLDKFAQMIAYECLTECAKVGVEAFGADDARVAAVDDCIMRIRKKFNISD